MKKFILMAMVAITVLASASAQSGGKVKLKMVLWDLNQATYIQPMVEAYTAQHPNVSIEFINISANDYTQKLAVMLAGGDTSDIISVKDIPMYASMVAKKQIEPLDSFIARDKIDLEQYSGVTDEITVDKVLYALPFRSDIWILYYNKDLFDKAKAPYPTNDMTWDQYAALARQVSFGQGVDRVYGSNYHTWRSTVQLPTVQDGKHSIITTDYSFMKPYYEMVLGMQKDKTVMDFASLKVGNMHYSSLFYNEQIAMMPMGSWFIGTLISKIKDGTADMKWGIARYPHPAGVPAGTTAGTITSLSVNAKSANKEAAWDFVKFFCGPEGANILAKIGSLPAIRNQQVLDSIKKIDGYPQDKTSAEALITKTVRLELPMHAKVAVIEKILNEQHELIMTGSVSIDQGLADMGRRVKEALAQ
ncbi:MAG TPA: sugar ABC transporter substrate-binding protein [Rectinemataceae bacterium]|nr:sugar ABC transporter substrate-binding protein [Rectinemataceae bacterium]